MIDLKTLLFVACPFMGVLMLFFKMFLKRPYISKHLDDLEKAEQEKEEKDKAATIQFAEDVKKIESNASSKTLDLIKEVQVEKEKNSALTPEESAELLKKEFQQ